MLDCTPVSNVNAGDIVLVGTEPRIAHGDIPAGMLGALAAGGGVYQVPKSSNAGSGVGSGTKVYWDPVNKIIATSGSAGTNAVQTITISGSPTGGTFTITVTVNGVTATTASIAYNASTATVQAALAALSNIGSTAYVTVTGTAGTSYVATFVGALAAQPITLMTATGSFTGGTSPAIAIANTTTGVYGIYLLGETTNTSADADTTQYVMHLPD